jgi:hypothetical protein
MNDFLKRTPSSLERLAGHVPLGLVSSAGELCRRSATIAEEFAELGIPGVDVTEFEQENIKPLSVKRPTSEVVDLFTRKRI